jgi:hypothetical protein
MRVDRIRQPLRRRAPIRSSNENLLDSSNNE